jgi:hypothetical protein
MNAKNKTHPHVDFGFSGKSISVEFVNKTFNYKLKPSLYHNCGEEYVGHNGKIYKRPWTVWTLSTKDKLKSLEIDEHVCKLLRIIAPFKKQIKNLSENRDTRVSFRFFVQLTMDLLSAVY